MARVSIVIPEGIMVMRQLPGSRKYHGRKDCRWATSKCYLHCNGFKRGKPFYSCIYRNLLSAPRPELYKGDGQPAGMKDVMGWWIATYPEDIFTGKTPNVRLVCEIRDRMKRLMKCIK